MKKFMTTAGGANRAAERLRRSPPQGRPGIARLLAAAFAFVGLMIADFGAAAFAQVPADTLFIRSATENPDGTVTLPLFRGSSGGQTVYYVITETFDATLSSQLGVNYAPVLANARNSSAVQYVSSNVTSNFAFPATVRFNAQARVVTINNPTSPLPIQAAQSSALGNPGYSPLVQLPNGIIVNAPQIANNTGNHPKVVSINTSGLRVTLDETDGFQGFQPVRYLGLDASHPGKAALENATFAPALANIPDPATADLGLITNGQRGLNNIQRQGLESALVDAADPLNILRFNPLQPQYSPIWEINPHSWYAGQNIVRLQDYDDLEAREQAGQLFANPNGVFGPAIAPFQNVYVNCPIVSRRSDSIAPSFTPVLASFVVTSLSRQLTQTYYSFTATVIDGTTGSAAAGVLVPLYLSRPSTTAFSTICTTTSSGVCTFTANFPIGNSVSASIISLNKSPQAPGVGDSARSLTVQ